MSTADATPAQDVASNADWFPISSLHPVLGHIVDLWDASERCRYADCFFDTGLGGWVREATDDNGRFCLIEVKGATHWAYTPEGPPHAKPLQFPAPWAELQRLADEGAARHARHTMTARIRKRVALLRRRETPR